MVDMLPP